jgi:hypothetical protein
MLKAKNGIFYILSGTYFLQKGKKSIVLNWVFSSGNNFFEEFIIERSFDNIEFKIIGKENKIRQPRRDFFYLFVDSNCGHKNNYYRICLKKGGTSKKIILMSTTIVVKVESVEPYIEASEKCQSTLEPVLNI